MSALDLDALRARHMLAAWEALSAERNLAAGKLDLAQYLDVLREESDARTAYWAALNGGVSNAQRAYDYFLSNMADYDYGSPNEEHTEELAAKFGCTYEELEAVVEAAEKAREDEVRLSLFGHLRRPTRDDIELAALRHGFRMPDREEP